MKSLILVLSFFCTQLSMAGVLEVSPENQRVYYHPTPILTVNVIDAGTDGGVMIVGLDYESTSTRQELDALKNQYPNYEIQAVMAESIKEIVTLILPEIGIHQDFRLRQGQMGPYLNSSLNLTKEQVATIKRSKEKLAVNFILKISAKTKYNDVLLKERFEQKEDLCLNFKAKNVIDIIQTLSSLQRPKVIKYDETFSQLKSSLLNNCFDLIPKNVASFSDLMKVEITTHRSRENIVVETFENKSVDKTFEISPVLKLEIQ